MTTINCSAALQLYDPQVQTCEFQPSSGSDGPEYWYSPFHADGSGVGHSGAYTLPLDAAGAPPPPQILRSDFSSAPPVVTCASSVARPRPMCINVDPADPLKYTLAPAPVQGNPGDFSDGVTYTSDNCTSTDKRWISDATAFAPPGDPQGRTTYEVRGCALDCIRPDLTGKNMETIEANLSSGDDFSVQFKCSDEFGPPLNVSPAVFSPGDRELMVGATGMNATKCAVDGGPYALNYTDGSNAVVAPPCVPDCTLPDDGAEYLGYDLAGTNLADINLSPSLLDPGAVSRHLICADGYTLRTGTAVSACSTPGGPIVINDETSPDNLGGCIADCKASDEAFNWVPDTPTSDTQETVHVFPSAGWRYLWQDPVPTGLTPRHMNLVVIFRDTSVL
jgi:hypothetical protein